MLYEVITMNVNAIQVVIFESNEVVPRGPKAVWLPDIPKAPARSAPRPVGMWMCWASNGAAHRSPVAPRDGRLFLQFVITSYSIHYTKLYDPATARRPADIA